MIHPSTIEFLADLKKNNNKEWFHANKPTYQKAKTNFEEFVTQIILEFGKVDESILSLTAKDCTFRINRDIRFSADKSPYKTNFGAYICKGGKKSKYSGYYVHLDPESCFVGGGVWMPPSPILKLVRNEIYFNLDKFLGVINDKGFKSDFKNIDQGEKLVNPPKGFPKDFEGAEWLKLKSFTVSKNIDKKLVLSDDFPKEVIRLFGVMKPFIGFINTGIDNEE